MFYLCECISCCFAEKVLLYTSFVRINFLPCCEFVSAPTLHPTTSNTIHHTQKGHTFDISQHLTSTQHTPSTLNTQSQSNNIRRCIGSWSGSSISCSSPFEICDGFFICGRVSEYRCEFEGFIICGRVSEYRDKFWGFIICGHEVVSAYRDEP